MTIQTPDLIKAVGFLTIYWGYLEMEVDTLIRFASPICPMPRGIAGAPITIDKFLEKPFRTRVEYLKKRLLNRCDAVQPYPDLARERQRTEVTLLAFLDAATERNTMMHSAIYSLSDTGPVKRERLSGSTAPVSLTAQIGSLSLDQGC
jgi:hypothetical protein